jgi:hypothetical protein
MIFNPHKLGIHKILSKIPLNALFDAPYKARLRKAVNIADLRIIGKARAHKVRNKARQLMCVRERLLRSHFRLARYLFLPLDLPLSLCHVFPRCVVFRACLDGV